MEKYKSLDAFLNAEYGDRESIMDMVARASTLLLSNAAHVFDGETSTLEAVGLPLQVLQEILTYVECEEECIDVSPEDDIEVLKK